MKIQVKGGRVLDPASGMDSIQDVFVSEGSIIGFTNSPDGFIADRLIDASGLIVCPGLVDVSVRLGQPGKEYTATLEKELKAAVASGVTTMACPPDTTPCLDEPGLVKMLRNRATALDAAKILPLGALTKSLQGRNLAEMVELSRAGCVAFSQGDGILPEPAVLRKAMEYASTFGFSVWLRPQENSLGGMGVAHEGEVSSRLGLTGVPVLAETVAVSVILMLAKETEANVHLCRLSSAAAVDLVRNAKKESVKVTADISVNNLHLSEVDIGFFDTNYRVTPPLRGVRDREGLRNGLADDSVDLICSNHVPVTYDDKNLPFAEAVPGSSSVELLLPMVLRWAKQEKIPLIKALEKITSNPRRVLGLPDKKIEIGEKTDLCIFDPDLPWVVDQTSILSGGKNTPFINSEVVGRNIYTIMNGKILFEDSNRAEK